MNTSRAFGVAAALEDLGLKTAELVGRVSSETTPGRRYYVRKNDGNYTCNCPDFKYRHAGRGTQCKHIRARLERDARTL